MALFADIRRFRSTGILPFAGGTSDQDAVFWEAREVVEAALVDAHELVKLTGAK